MMGIDVHNLKFLKYARTKQALGNTITIGRQGLYLTQEQAGEILGAAGDFRKDEYCEKLLVDHLGATAVDSVDNSGYEHATLIHDMNHPVPESMQGNYDTIIDGGCLEHIYNVTQAFKNCSSICKPGGQILHMLPANNFCGHGFWQFSPELFFSLYSSENGYQETEVFLADLTDTTRWWEVKRPVNGNRVNIVSSTELYVLVRTVRAGDVFTHESVQQSDYLYEWQQGDEPETQAQPEASSGTGIRQKLKKVPFLYSLLSPAYHQYLEYRRQRTLMLGPANPNLVEFPIK